MVDVKPQKSMNSAAIWAMIEHLIKDEKWPFWVGQMKKKLKQNESDNGSRESLPQWLTSELME